MTYMHTPEENSPLSVMPDLLGMKVELEQWKYEPQMECCLQTLSVDPFSFQNDVSKLSVL